jgi:hypothetical protein
LFEVVHEPELRLDLLDRALRDETLQ